MSSMSERLPSRADLDEISRQAHAMNAGDGILTIIAAALFGIFWLAAKAFRVTVFAGKWCFVAGRRGWRSGMGQPDPVPSVQELMKIIDQQGKALKRYEEGFVGPIPVS